MVIHATFKFFLDDWATSHDRPADWKCFFIYGVTKQFSIFGVLQTWLGSGIAFWLVRKWKLGAREEGEETGGNGDEEDVVGEETPLMSSAREEEGSSGIIGGEEKRFRVLLKGRWRDGAGINPLAAS